MQTARGARRGLPTRIQHGANTSTGVPHAPQPMRTQGFASCARDLRERRAQQHPSTELPGQILDARDLVGSRADHRELQPFRHPDVTVHDIPDVKAETEPDGVLPHLREARSGR